MALGAEHNKASQRLADKAALRFSNVSEDETLKDRMADGEKFGDWSHILFDQALLAEGGQLEDPATFVRRLNELWLAI